MYNWELPFSFFYRGILWDFHMNLGENLTHTEQDLWRTFIVFRKVGAVQQEQKITLCWGTVHIGSKRKARSDVLCSGGWVSCRHCIAKVWSGDYVCVCVCVSLIWMLSFEPLSPVPQPKDMDMQFSVFTASDVWGWNLFLPWNVKSYFRFCVR